MQRTTYRLLLVSLCAVAAFVGPIIFLEDRPRAGYLLGGVGSALLTWLLLQMTLIVEPHLPAGIQGIIGAAAARFSWLMVTLVAAFKVLPSISRNGMALFDPVWLVGGFSPLVIIVVTVIRAMRAPQEAWKAFCSALFRFSVPLYGLQLAVDLLDLPKQFYMLALFTGVMFLVLDVLGIGTEQGLLKGKTALGN